MNRLLRRARRSRRLIAGLGLLALSTLAAIISTVVGGDPFQVSDTLLAPPSTAHPMGTDELGRDVLSRVLHGAGTSLYVATCSVALAAVAGIVVGLIAGYWGGVMDDLLLKVGELFQALPMFLLALVAAALFGSNTVLLIAVLAAGFWPTTARLVRAETLGLREQPYVEAVRSLGARHPRILFRHLLPGVLPVAVVNSSFQAGIAVLIEAGLSFLGLGDRDVLSWGTMIADAQAYVTVAWWMSLFPGLAVGITVLGMNLAGDGLNDAVKVRAE